MRIGSTGRGIHPVIDEDTYLAWQLDEASGSTAYDMIGQAHMLVQSAALPVPTYALGVCGNARVFDGTMVLARGASTADITLAEGEWTLSHWVRVLEVPALGDDGVIVGLSGPDASETGANNAQLRSGIVGVTSGVNTVAVPRMHWEQGIGGTDVTTDCDPDLFRFTLGQWTLVAWVKSLVAGLATLRLYVNGSLVQTTAGLTNADSGTLTSQRWTLGASLTSTPTVTRGISAEISSVALTSRVLTQTELAEDFRRGVGMAGATGLHFRALVADGADDLIDLTDPDVTGEDWAVSAVLDDKQDTPCEALTLTLVREQGDLSLAPLKGDSRLNNATLSPTWTPQIDVWRRVELDIARVPCWLAPVADDWQVRYEGRVDDYDDGGDALVLRCRDLGARLMDRAITVERQYPATADLNTGGCGTTAGSRETTLARILTDNGALATLFVPEATGSCMVQKVDDDGYLPRGFLMPTLRTIAQQIGWDLRYRWDPLTESHRLTFSDPQRDRLAADVVIAPADVLKTEQAQTSVAEVRNDIVVAIADSDTLDGQLRWLPNAVSAEDAASIAAYDRRTMTVIEEAALGIDTTTEAQRMADAALADLSTPRRAVSMTVLGLPEAGVNDLVTMLPDRLRTTTVQQGAVREITTTFARDGVTTRMSADGRPSLGTDRWLYIEAGRVGRYPLQSPGDGLASRSLGMKLPAFQAIAVRTLALSCGTFGGCQNADFARATQGDAYPPDNWTVTFGTWGTDIVADTAGAFSGGRAVKFVDAPSVAPTLELTSDPVAVNPGYPFSVELTYTGSAISFGELRAVISWLDEDRALISSVGPFTFDVLTAGDFVTVLGGTPPTGGVLNIARVPPSGSRFAQLRLQRTVANPSGDLIIDAANLVRVSREAKMTLGFTAQSGVANFNPASPSNVQVELTDASGTNGATGYLLGGGFSFGVGSDTYRVGENALYDVHGQIRAEVDSSATLVQCGASIHVNGTRVIAGPRVSGAEDDDGTVQGAYATASGTIRLAVGDVVTLRGFIESSGGTRSFAAAGSSTDPAPTFLALKARTRE